MSRFVPSLTFGLPSLILALVGCGGDVCSDPNGALAAAAAGETVNIVYCIYDGDVTVPPGVHLTGRGPEDSRIIGQVTLGPGAQISRIFIEANGPVGISAVGPGDSVTISDVEVLPSRGVGVQIEGIGAQMENVMLRGPVTEDTAAELPPMPSSDDTATHGLLLLDAGSPDAPVTLDRVSVSGFARFGALFRNSHVRWSNGSSTANLTVGAMAEGGTLDLENVGLGGNFQGVQPFPAFGGVFTGGADVSTTDLLVDGNEGYGLLHDDATVAHVDLVASDNGDAAVWVQSGRAFMLAGESSALSGNRLAGVVLVGTDNAMIQDATIDTSVLGTRIEGETGMIQVGDGIHAVMDTAAGLIVDQVSMTHNARAGMLLDVATGDVEGAVMNVTVDADGDGLGVIAQGPSGPIPSGTWDTEVTRLGATVANDAALDEILDTVGIVGPMFLPPPSM